MFLYAENYKKLNEILDAVIAAENPYEYICIDTMTALEQYCLPEAARLYSQTPMGVNWIVKDADGKLDRKKSQCVKYNNDITFLPNGSGYQYVRSAFAKITTKLKKCAKNVIYIAHVKEKNLTKDGVEFTSNDLNLLGKNKQALSADAQAIGYLSRIGDKNYISFQAGNDILAGCKVKRLADKEILISEYDEKGELITHWDQIYIK